MGPSEVVVSAGSLVQSSTSPATRENANVNASVRLPGNTGRDTIRGEFPILAGDKLIKYYLDTVNNGRVRIDGNTAVQNRLVQMHG